MPHPWPALSPEENHLALTSGPGSATTLAHAATLTAYAEQLQEVVSASQVNAAHTYGTAWSGVGATAAQRAHTRVNTDLAALAEWAAEKPPIVTAAAEAYHSAVAAMVPAADAVSNRVQEAADVEANPRCFGALSPRIAALNDDYFGHMWPTNAAAGANYGAVLRTSMAALSTPPPAASSATSPDADAAAATDDEATASGAAMRQAHRSVSETMTRAATLQPPSPPPPVQAPPARLAEMRPPAAVPQQPPVGMYQRPPPVAAVYGPPTAAAAPVAPPASQAPAVAAGRPGMATGLSSGGYPGAGLTRYIRPAEAFATPAALSGHPEILNAAALQQPVTPPSPTQHLQPIHAPPPHPAPPPTAQSPAAPATAAPEPPSSPPPPAASPPPAQPAIGNYLPSGEPAAPGSSPGGTQMLGFGSPGIVPPPQAPPQFPVPQQPPQPPQPPSPSDAGEPGSADGGAGGAVELSVHDARDVHREVDPLPPGKNPGVKELPTPEEIRRLYEQLTENAGSAPRSTYPGDERMLEDGTRIGYRPNSGSGGPTVDIRYPDGTRVKVHLPEPPKGPEPEPAAAPAPAPIPAPSRPPVPADSDGPSIHLPPAQVPPPQEQPGIWATIGAIILGALALGGLGAYSR